MNIYEKLQNMRVELQQKNIKKSGRNKFAGYDYFELSDILPPINELQAKYKTCSFVSFNSEEATLKIVNAEDPKEEIVFVSPIAGLNLKGAHEIQNLGGIQTYSRRYLYLNAFEIIENEFFDAVQGKDQPQVKTKQKKPLSAKTSSMLNMKITNYAELSNKAINEITEELTKQAGKSLKTITEDEGKALLKYLEMCIHKIQVRGGE